MTGANTECLKVAIQCCCNEQWKRTKLMCLLSMKPCKNKIMHHKMIMICLFKVSICSNVKPDISITFLNSHTVKYLFTSGTDIISLTCNTLLFFACYPVVMTHNRDCTCIEMKIMKILYFSLLNPDKHALTLSI